MASQNIGRYLKKLYRKPGIKGGSLGSALSLYRSVLSDGKYNIPLSQIKKFLNEQKAYSLNRQFRTHFLTEKVIVGGINELHQADLIDMSKYSKWNNNVHFLLLVIDTFSKYLWVVPLINKTNVAVLEALNTIYSNYQSFPITFSTDKGKEFQGKLIQDFLANNDVGYVNSHGNTKAQFAERAVRTIKKFIFSFMSMHSNKNYLDILPEIVKNYNNTFSRTIKTSPSNVSELNAKQVFHNLYGSNMVEIIKKHIIPSKNEIKQQIFKIGDFVRVLRKKGVFEKRFHDNFSAEIFKIQRILLKKTIQYKIEDLSHEEIIGKFYKQELQKTGKDNLVEIDKIVGKFTKDGDDYVKVKWKYYPKKFNSIILAANVKTIT